MCLLIVSSSISSRFIPSTLEAVPKKYLSIKGWNSKLLKENQFVFTAETSPPDSGNKDAIIKEVECLDGLADAVNVTDGAGAKSHMSALVTAAILVQNGIEPILQFTTRDRNRIAIQGDLLGGWALDIPNILCLYGDEVKGTLKEGTLAKIDGKASID